MILFEIVNGDEDAPIYQFLEIANGNRQYDFLRSIVDVSLEVQKSFLSTHILKALNFQAITCLHTNAGEYRPCQVTVGNYHPPEHYRVQALMDDFINTVNRLWESMEPTPLAAFVLWKLNHIHPFINGNGRVARAACYFVLCVKFNRWLPGSTILPELLRLNRSRYVGALRDCDASYNSGDLNLSPLCSLLDELLNEQINSVKQDSPPSAIPALPAPQKD